MSSPTTNEAARPTRHAASFPHEYVVGLEWPGTGPGRIKASPRPAIVGGPPPQFGGEDTWWSPEHLLLSAANLCLMTTFAVFAEKRMLPVLAYRGLVKGVLDKTPAGLAFTSILLHVEMEVPAGREEQAEAVLRSAKAHCIVANSLKTPVELHVEVRSR